MAEQTVEGSAALVLVKLETTYATDPTATVAADVIEVEDGFKADVDVAMLARKRIRYHPTSAGKTPGRRVGKATIPVKLGGPPDPNTDPLAYPACHALLLASMMSVASSGSPVDTHVYSQKAVPPWPSVAFESYTVDGENAWEKMQFLGFRCGWTFKAERDSEAMFTFEGMGKYTPPVDANPDPTDADGVYDTDSAAVVGVTLTIGGTAYPCKSMEITWGIKIEEIAQINDATGVGYLKPSRGPDTPIEIKFTPERRHVDNRDDFAAAITGETGAFVFTIDTLGGARWTFAGAALQRGAFTFSRDGDIYRLDQTAYLQDTSGPNALTITVTRTP